MSNARHPVRQPAYSCEHCDSWVALAPRQATPLQNRYLTLPRSGPETHVQLARIRSCKLHAWRSVAETRQRRRTRANLRLPGQIL